MKVLFCHHSQLLADALAGLLNTVPGFEAHGSVFDESGECGEMCRDDYDVVVMGQVALLNPKVKPTCECADHGAGHKRVLLGAATYVPNFVEALHAGFDGMLDVNCSLEEMVDRLEAVHSGRSHLRDSPLVKNSSIPTEALPRTLVYKDDIDEQVCGLVALGFTDKQISDALYIAQQTVRNRLSRILGDSGLKNRTQIAIVYLANRRSENPDLGPND